MSHYLFGKTSRASAAMQQNHADEIDLGYNWLTAERDVSN
jgi:hypothetical protein